jgi:predicted ATP-grasp superfamily ATP-dependent carboligase
VEGDEPPEQGVTALDGARSPVVIAAFEGWNDAGDAASGALTHMIETWDASKVWEMDPEDYYDFQVNRPAVHLVDGVSRAITWPTTKIYLASPPDSSVDVLLVRGIEPNMRWRGFCAEILDLIEGAGATRFVTLGALLADAPHRRPVQVTGTAPDVETARRMGLTNSRYEGPTGIVGVIADLCLGREIEALSFWAAIPHYYPNAPCSKAVLALVRRVEELLDITVPLGSLVEDARSWERRVDEYVEEDAEVADYVRTLEEREPAEDLPDASGDAIAREFQRWLQRPDQER